MCRLIETTLGSQVKNWREYRGLGVRELARLADIDPGYISRIEADQKVPSPAVLKRITKALRLIDGYFSQYVAVSLFNRWKR